MRKIDTEPSERERLPSPPPLRLYGVKYRTPVAAAPQSNPHAYTADISPLADRRDPMLPVGNRAKFSRWPPRPPPA